MESRRFIRSAARTLISAGLFAGVVAGLLFLGGKIDFHGIGVALLDWSGWGNGITAFSGGTLGVLLGFHMAQRAVKRLHARMESSVRNLQDLESHVRWLHAKEKQNEERVAMITRSRSRTQDEGLPTPAKKVELNIDPRLPAEAQEIIAKEFQRIFS